MILTDYYRFERLEATSAKLRIDCTASTGSYEPLEEKRATKQLRHTDKRDGCNVGDLFCYFGDVPEQFGGDVHRKADKALTKSKNISSIYTPDPKSTAYQWQTTGGGSDRDICCPRICQRQGRPL